MRHRLILIAPEAASTIEVEARRSADGSETGGILLGHDAVGERPVLVTVAGDPGPGAQRSPGGFLRDRRHAETLADAAYDADGSTWVGEWHTHPDETARPSWRDLSTYRKLMDDIELGFSEIVSVIVTPEASDWQSVGMHGWLVRRVSGPARRLMVSPAELRRLSPEEST